MSYEAIIFDVDGVIADTVDDFTWIDKIYKREFPPPEEAGFSNWDDYLDSYGDAFRKLSSENGAEVLEGLNVGPEKVIDTYRKLQQKKSRIMTQFSPFDDAKPVLEELYQEGIKLAAVSNASESNTKKFLKQNDLDKYFEVINGVNTESFNHFRDEKKPNPDMLENAITLMDVNPDNVVMVGDSSTDQFAAENAGIDFIKMNRGENNTSEEIKIEVEDLFQLRELV